MWDAKATQYGAMVYDWGNDRVIDPLLRGAFAQANQELLWQSGMTSDDMLALGWIAYSETREPLEIATGRKCTNDSSDGIMYWSAEEVRRINKNTYWEFVYGGLGSYYQFERMGYWSARLFWQTCVDNGLGIRFSW